MAETQPVRDNDPALLDKLPYAAGKFAALAHVRAALYDAFDIQAFYRQDKQQATVWVTITESTPAIIAALLSDPRTDNDTAATPPATFGDSLLAPISTAAPNISVK